MCDGTFDTLCDDDTPTSPPACAGAASQAAADASPDVDAHNAPSRPSAHEEPCRRGGAGLYLRLDCGRGLGGFVKDPRSGAVNYRRSSSPGPMFSFF